MKDLATKIVPHLWFVSDAQEAVSFYISLFSDSRIISETTIEGTPSGDTDIISFDLRGQSFMAINGGPAFRFSEAVSFFVYCGSDNEINRLYESLSAGGSVLMPLGQYDWTRRYAWVKDKYGVSWQLDVDDINHKQKIVPSLLFVNERATLMQEAVSYYCSVFHDSRVLLESPWDKSAGMPDGALLFAQFSLSGNIFNTMSSNIHHDFDFNEAVSFMVYCDTQEEIDYFWEKLLEEGGEEQACGWLKDRFGVSWQIVPGIMDEMMATTDKAKLARVTEATLKMVKLDIKQLIDASNAFHSE
jgi:predicted 3-demethylubiquinone-9 3-methyltransferase (glyoxalase superfamily)